jgi:CMP-N,N'-diacetyllegionaminic acid synthase
VAKFGRVLAIVPARGGSKGIPLKNIRLVGGKPLLGWTLEIASQTPGITDICVTTDHHQIRSVASRYPGVGVVRRPDELAGDRVPDAPVLQHATEIVEAEIGLKFDVIVMLQVTSPLRTVDDITECLELLAATDCDSVWTVSVTDSHYHPLKQLVMHKGAFLEFYDERGSVVIARQELDQVYHRNGACYAVKRDFLMGSSTLHSPNRTKALVSRGERINIDTEADLLRADQVLSRKLSL